MRPLTDAEHALLTRYAPRPTLDAPTSGIFDTPAYSVSVNAAWLPHIIGVLHALDQPDAWLGTETQIEDARNQVRKLIAAFEVP